MSVGLERVRCLEPLFQPSLIGTDQAGIPETLWFVLQRYPADVRADMVKNIFLTGGNVRYPGFAERMAAEVQAMLPFQSEFDVFAAHDPLNDAWLGASEWCRQKDFEKWSFTRKEYLEMGAHYLQEHCASNVLCRSANA